MIRHLFSDVIDNLHVINSDIRTNADPVNDVSGGIAGRAPMISGELSLCFSTCTFEPTTVSNREGNLIRIGHHLA